MKRRHKILIVAAVGLILGFLAPDAMAETYMDDYGEIPPPRYDYEISPRPVLIPVTLAEIQLICSRGAVAINDTFRGGGTGDIYYGCALGFLDTAGKPFGPTTIANLKTRYLEQAMWIADPVWRRLAEEAIRAGRCVIPQLKEGYASVGWLVHNYRHERGHCAGWRHL